jgi:hypothetical protein
MGNAVPGSNNRPSRLKMPTFDRDDGYIVRHLAPKYIGHPRGLNVMMLPSFD